MMRARQATVAASRRSCRIRPVSFDVLVRPRTARHRHEPISGETSATAPSILLSFLASLASAQTKTQDVITRKAGGTAFTMDVLKPAKPRSPRL